MKPQIKIFDRTFDVCLLANAKRSFKALKNAMRNRLNVPLTCPVKKGLVVVDLELRVSDIPSIIKAVEECKRLLPSANILIGKHTMNVKLSATTKINNIFVKIGALEIRNLSATVDSAFKFLRELFHLAT